MNRTGPGEIIFAAAGSPLLQDVLQRHKQSVALAIMLRERAWFEIDLIAAAHRYGAKIERIDHHLAHAWCAAFLSGFKQGTVVTADGQGDEISTAAWRLQNGTLVQRWSAPIADGSAGFFFAAITELLGYRRLQDEGKVTALAAGGHPCAELAKLMSQALRLEPAKSGKFRLRVSGSAVRSWTRDSPLYTQSWAQQLRRFEPRDIAFSAQRRLEEVMVDLVSRTLASRADGQLALAGGLFANVSLNRKIAEIPNLRHLFVSPPMGDEGTAIGAAAAVANKLGIEVAPCRSMFLGTSIAQREPAIAANALPGWTLRTNSPEQTAHLAARLLASGQLVARCAGPAEFGPRALGNRSLFCRPNDPTCREWLNQNLGRDSIMPFSPCIRTEDLAEIACGPARGPATFDYMTIAVPVRPKFRRSCAGVVHIDGTVRLQSVSRTAAPALWELLGHFTELTGLPALLNTSLNRHGEPICRTLTDALMCAAISGIDYVLCGDSFIFCRGNAVKSSRIAG